MRKLLRRPAFWAIIGLWTLFLPLMFFIPRQDLFELLNAFIFSLGVGIVISYASGAIDALRQHPGEPMSAGDVLVLGIFIAWAGVIGIFSFLWLYRVNGDETLRNHGLAAFARWVLVTGGIFHLAASGAVEGRVPLAAYRRVGVTLAVGLAIALGLISFGVV